MCRLRSVTSLEVEHLKSLRKERGPLPPHIPVTSPEVDYFEFYSRKVLPALPFGRRCWLLLFESGAGPACVIMD
jgi:hypothetical protein